MRAIFRRVVAITVCVLALAWAAAAGATQNVLDQNQQIYSAGSYQSANLQEGGALYSAGSQGATSQAQAATTYWWHYTTSGYYDFVLPGTASGAYPSYYNAAVAINSYLDSAYGAASGLLGVGNNGYGHIDLWLTTTGSTTTAGWYYAGQNANNIFLNLSVSGTAAFFGGVAAHETTHLLLDHAANLYNRDAYGTDWYTEALAYYVGNSVYAYGNNYGYSYNSSLFKRYSNDGATRSDWYSSGARYLNGNSSTFDWVQLNVIGYFLAHSNRGWSAIQDTVSNLSRNMSLESSLQAAYGLASGMYDSASGAGVQTLYSYYINYYLGHY